MTLTLNSFSDVCMPPFHLVSVIVIPPFLFFGVVSLSSHSCCLFLVLGFLLGTQGVEVPCSPIVLDSLAPGARFSWVLHLYCFWSGLYLLLLWFWYFSCPFLRVGGGGCTVPKVCSLWVLWHAICCVSPALGPSGSEVWRVVLWPVTEHTRLHPQLSPVWG